MRAAGVTTPAQPRTPRIPKDVWVVSEAEDGATSSACNPVQANQCWSTRHRAAHARAARHHVALTAGVRPGRRRPDGDCQWIRLRLGHDSHVQRVSRSRSTDLDTQILHVRHPAQRHACRRNGRRCRPRTHSGATESRCIVIHVRRSGELRAGHAVPHPRHALHGRANRSRRRVRPLPGHRRGIGTDPADATAVVLNVTEVSGTASSLLTVYPYRRPPRPNAVEFELRERIR